MHLLLLTRAYIPNDVQVVIKGSDFALNIYEYFPIRKWNISPHFMESFEYDLTNSMLDPLGFDYDSTIANTYPSFISIFFSIILYFFIILIRWFLLKFRDSWNCAWFIKKLSYVFDKGFKMMTFGYFIRNGFELSQFILISSINEVYENNTSSSNRLISFIFAILMIILFLIFCMFAQYLIWISYKVEENRHNMFEEFFIGLKKTKKSRIFIIALLLRKLIFIAHLIALVLFSSKLVISILTSFQVIYIWFVIYVRPYEEVKGNIIEIVNELYFTPLLFVLIFLNSIHDWNSVNTNVYLWVLSSNSIVVFLIVFSKFY